MFEKFKEIKKDALRIKMPMHIAITMEGTNAWSKKNKISLADAYNRNSVLIKSAAKSQVKLKIPIITFFMLPEDVNKDTDEFSACIGGITNFFDSISNHSLFADNKIKVSVLGRWYDLPGSLVESIKRIINETKDYDGFFLNFCINYSGQEEIVDACKLIARQVNAGKLDPDIINKELIKENIYSSYFVPPDLIIKNGYKKITSGILLWDSAKSKLYFTNKLFPDFDRMDLMDAIREFQKGE